MKQFLYCGQFPNQDIAGVIDIDDVEFDPLNIAITPMIIFDEEGSPEVKGWLMHKRTLTNIAEDITGEHKVVPRGALGVEDVY